MSECLFCKIVVGEIPASLVAESEHSLAFEDIAPQAPVHVLVIPKFHVEFVHDTLASPEVLADVFALADDVVQREGVKDSGYRLVFNVGPDAQQSVPHVHLHVLGGRKLSWPPG